MDLVVAEGAHTALNKPEVMALLKSSRTKKLVISHRYDRANTDGMVAELMAYTKDKFQTVLAYDNMILDVKKYRADGRQCFYQRDIFLHLN